MVVDHSIPGPDGGWGWMVAVAAGTTDVLTTSTIFSMSPFYIELRSYFGTTAAMTSLVVSLLQVGYLFAFIGTFCTDRIGARKTVMIFGTIAAIGTFMGQFASNIYHLHATLGFITGLGFAGCLAPSHVTNARYFPHRYPLANGIAMCIPGLGLFIFPPLFQACINKYGWRGTLMIVAGILANLCVCGAILRPLKRRPNVKEVNGKGPAYSPAKTDECLEKEAETHAAHKHGIAYVKEYLVLFRNGPFVVYLMSVLLIQIAYTGIMLHLQPRASQAGIGTLQQTSFLVSITGVVGMFGRVGASLVVHFKFLSSLTVYIFSVILLGITCFVLHFGQMYLAYAILSGIVGLTAGMTFAIWNVCCRDLVSRTQLSHSFSILYLSIGFGGVLGPLIAGKIYDTSHDYDITFFAFGVMCITSGVILIPPLIWKRLKNSCCNKKSSPEPVML